jgi:putative transposase
MEKDQYRSKYRITSARLNGWDYGSHGLYFVTICTKDKMPYFGQINVNPVETQNFASLQQTEIGNIASQNWLEIPKHFPFVELDEYVIMPDHMHGIVFINKPDKTDWQPNKFGSQSQNLASIIRGYKVSVKKYATLNNIEFTWQPRYYDRVIRDEKEYLNIREYIYNNPSNWILNKDSSNNLYPL